MTVKQSATLQRIVTDLLGEKVSMNRNGEIRPLGRIRVVYAKPREHSLYFLVEHTDGKLWEYEAERCLIDQEEAT